MCTFQSHISSVRLENPLWILKQKSFVNELEKSVWVVDPTRGQKLINKILLFQYSYTDISATVGIRGTVIYALESTWLVVYCVLNSKPHLFRGLRKSPLNIETIEFCWWAGKIQEAHWQNSFVSIFTYLYLRDKIQWNNWFSCIRKH